MMTYYLKNIFCLLLIGFATVAMAGCASTSSGDEDDKAVYSVADDRKLENEIRQAIMQEAGLASDRIRVSVRQRVVTVSGSVSNRMHADRIERVLRQFEDRIRGYNIEVSDAQGRF